MSIAYADRVILSPSPSALAPDAARGEVAVGTGEHPLTSYWANFGSAVTEIEVAALHKPNEDAGAISIESQLLPETSGLPSLAIGIRDLGNNTYNYGASGYYGRSAYVVGGRKPIQLAAAPYPIRNLSYTVGAGGFGIKGPFGSVSADLPFNFHWTVEWDSRDFNGRLAWSLSNSASLQYERFGSANYIGFALFTPATIF